MALPREDELLRTLPEPTRTRLSSFLREFESGSVRWDTGLKFTALVEELGLSRAEIPLARSLTNAQRAFFEICVQRPELHFAGGVLYLWPRWSIRRWLGLEPRGALEQEIHGVPRWHAFAAVRNDIEAITRLLADLPPTERLAVYGELDAGAYAFGTPEIAMPGWEALRDEGRSWAPAHADWLLSRARDGEYQIPKHVRIRLPLFLSWVRSGIAIERRWEVFLPVTSERIDILRECLEALPESRRAAAIGAALPPASPEQILATVASLIDTFPMPGLIDVIFDRHRGWHRPTKQTLAAVDAIAKRHPELADAVAAAKKKKPIKLVVRAAACPPESKLSALQKRQIARLDEGAHEHLEVFAIEETKGTRRYDAIVHAGSDGCVFVAGSDEPVALIAQGGADGDDGDLCVAIDEAFEAFRRKAKGRRA